MKANAGKKKVTLELGGNAGEKKRIISDINHNKIWCGLLACIVDDLDETLDTVVDRIITGAFYQSKKKKKKKKKKELY